MSDATTQTVSLNETAASSTPNTNTNDLISRVSKIQQSQQTSDNSLDNSPKISLDEIKDPIQKSILEKKIKDLESGYNKKFMQVAEERKKAEAMRLELESKLNKPITREYVQELLKRPDFIQAAQEEYQSKMGSQAPENWEGTQEQWSNLSDSDKHAFNHLRNQVNSLLSQQQLTANAQEHDKVKSKFHDYDPQLVDKFLQDSSSLSGERIKELVWKAINYEKHMERAYKLAYEDKSGTIKEKINGSTNPASMSVASSPDKPTAVQGERTSQSLKRLFEWNLKNQK